MNTQENAGPALRSFYPGLVTARFYETWDFYTTHLGFRTLWEENVYVHLVHSSGAQLALLKEEAANDAPELVSATDGRGFWLRLDVGAVDEVHARLAGEGVDIVSPPEDKPWGDRQFSVRDPNGVLIMLSQRLCCEKTLKPELVAATT
jgi:uncharacterized glyoxalase superfamily protein PhnB